ncbi:hypothetical protein [Caldivirga maquilingensis]|uniref:Uncharacterized protein n=1 Tax=Caldivirga maquilingensis (strain ATCC 700844 / DSM 13496 / JCM 10307 / IC-167) TaxID=397948 RepID=A8MAL0_CALMQ|nr:hypothetical protein [Caldivirga maquilingensis]ABW02587.1 hypothetical protein Cmaq_1764 [Caldivirga maquilingensis IC-167]
MRLTVQRSIPFPRISLSRLINYLTYIKDNGIVNINDLREAGLDFGKGKGDITRFFEKLGLVTVHGEAVSLTSRGEELVNGIKEHGVMAFHEYLLSELPQYRLLIDVLRDLGKAKEDDVLTELNRRIALESPAAWVNRVALRSMLGLLQDLGVVVKVNGAIAYVNNDFTDPLECLSRVSVQVNGQYLVGVRELGNCLGRVIDPSSLIECGVLITAPNNTLLRFSNMECVARLLRTYQVNVI